MGCSDGDYFVSDYGMVGRMDEVPPVVANRPYHISDCWILLGSVDVEVAPEKKPIGDQQTETSNEQ